MIKYTYFYHPPDRAFMKVITRLKHYLLTSWPVRKGTAETDPASAYDIWALSYDNQPDNLMLALDDELFSGFVNEIDLKEATVADVGCGTGRHWNEIIAKGPKDLFGFDISEGMLQVLQKKFPQAKTFLLHDNHLTGLANNSCDLVVSTLALAHIEDIRQALEEWCRVLKRGGVILITDYHPEALAKGAKRTFRHQDKLIAVRNHVHSIKTVRKLARQLDLEVLRFTERRIDDSVRSYYQKQNALPVFERFKDMPIIYGIFLKKTDASV
jgi:ubiquinone/menaquinone biosynthesis C-methylase UbiE